MAKRLRLDKKIRDSQRGSEHYSGPRLARWGMRKEIEGSSLDDIEKAMEDIASVEAARSSSHG